MKNINSKIERYKSLKSEVDEILKEIKNQEKLLNKAEVKLNNYFENNIIKLRLGNLIDNLSLILKVKRDDFNHKIAFKTSISINKDIDDIIVKYDLNTLSNDSKETNIIIQALNKCDNLNEEKVKKLGGNYE